MPDWRKVKEDYLNDKGSYRDLARKYRISMSALSKRAKREGWVVQKNTRQDKIATQVAQKTIEKTAEAESDIATIQARIKRTIYEQIEARIGADAVDNTDFRRLVQCYADMMHITDGTGGNEVENLAVLADMLKKEP